jgi:hypothetical protein
MNSIILRGARKGQARCRHFSRRDWPTLQGTAYGPWLDHHIVGQVPKAKHNVGGSGRLLFVWNTNCSRVTAVMILVDQPCSSWLGALCNKSKHISVVQCFLLTLPPSHTSTGATKKMEGWLFTIFWYRCSRGADPEWQHGLRVNFYSCRYPCKMVSAVSVLVEDCLRIWQWTVE